MYTGDGNDVRCAACENLTPRRELGPSGLCLECEMKPIISSTGVAHGWGSDPYKWVSGLTKEERRAVKDGKTVLVTGCPPCGGGSGKGCTTRRVLYISKRYVHRCACGMHRNSYVAD